MAAAGPSLCTACATEERRAWQCSMPKNGMQICVKSITPHS